MRKEEPTQEKWRATVSGANTTCKDPQAREEVEGPGNGLGFGDDQGKIGGEMEDLDFMATTCKPF